MAPGESSHKTMAPEQGLSIRCQTKPLVHVQKSGFFLVDREPESTALATIPDRQPRTSCS